MLTRSRLRARDNTSPEDSDTTAAQSNIESIAIDNDEMVAKQLNKRSGNGKMAVAAPEETGETFMQMTNSDQRSVLLLLLLYLLQGIPLGLAGSVPYILVSKKVPYSVQATFSFVVWPFSIKLLWAPLVDSLYSARFGRRKSWLIPVQYLLGITMLWLSRRVDGFLGNGDSSSVAVLPLTVAFFGLNFLAATQDIAVDGWALNMLSRRNVGWASTCNSVGQTAGYFLSYVVFLALESASFCNAYLRPLVAAPAAAHGLVTFPQFLHFFGLVFLVITTLVMLLKHERAEPELELAANKPQLWGTYKLLWSIMRNTSVQAYLLTLFSVKFAFAAADGITGLKLIERGVPKEKLALFSLALLPLQLMLPVMVARRTAGPRPLYYYMRSVLPRLVMGLGCLPIVYFTPNFKNADGSLPLYYYVVLCAYFGLHQVFIYTMFVTQMAFHNKISDSRIGGSCMTLFNTASNLAGNWPVTFLLYSISFVTWQKCSVASAGTCSSPALVQACAQADGACVTSVEGYYVLSVLCLLWGLVALRWRWRPMERLETVAWSLSD